MDFPMETSDFPMIFKEKSEPETMDFPMKWEQIPVDFTHQSIEQW